MIKKLLWFISAVLIISVLGFWVKNQSTSVSFSSPASIDKKIISVDKEPMMILALGDSLTDGYNISQTKAFPKLVENQLNQEFSSYHTTIINAGISGSTTQSALFRLQKHIDQHSRIHILLLALGANDGLRGTPIVSIQNNLQKTIDFALSKNISVVLAGMKVPPSYGLTYSLSFQKMYKTLAKKNNITLIPFLLKGVAMKPALNLPDGIHPNPSGHKIIAQTVFFHLKKFYK